MLNVETKEEQRARLYSLLGDLPNGLNAPVSSRTVYTESRDGYTVEKLVLDLNGEEEVPAYFVRPNEGKGPFPTLLFHHSHGGRYELGKDELLKGNTYLQEPCYADALTGAGYAALCIDAWGFGERRGRKESELFKEMLWKGQVLWGKMVYDALRAADYLAQRPDVDADRLGTLGISMGSTMAWWQAALDTRIRVCIDLCCLTDFDALIETGAIDAHGVYYYVPSLLKHFSAADINALIAPRAHFSYAGIYDALTPPAGLDRIDDHLKRVYESEGASEAWSLHRSPTGHLETPAMRTEVMQRLAEYL
ncbi:dienelactone hydrolase family protein [Paenibacillus montanisoli]|uniref:Alpha/beta hydrolase n=1 Tax=Paenibacillus montanisoli TaxID=2081970 RepID=A0A328TWC5_9BACL|nr:CocE/NonD family hydrolase [Paenibacillus montanisoli]RAP74650.1 alpha/beta hydrolase [Paenibacillus montanisoli]